jgi:hypothetical protein
VAVGKARETRALVAFNLLRSRHFRTVIIDSRRWAVLASHFQCGATEGKHWSSLLIYFEEQCLEREYTMLA